PSLSVPVTAAFPPGVYLFKLVVDSGAQHYIPLTSRDDRSAAAFVVQNSVTTWQAYNLWGGYDLYEGKNGSNGSDFEHRARVVSFDRPYSMGAGSGDFLGNEFPLISLVESLGLDVTYWTDIDLHERAQLLSRHRALLSLGHDEYWSRAMRTGAEQARDRGLNIAFLGANAIFRHIRLEASHPGPKNVQLMAHSPLRCGGKYSYSDMTYYTASSGAGVWASGTNWWISKLSEECTSSSSSTSTSSFSTTTAFPATPSTRLTSPTAICPKQAAVKITENVLNLFGAGPAGRTQPSTATNVRDLN